MRFEDDDFENDEEYMNKEAIMKMHQDQVEKAFFETLNSGKDITVFLYMPMEFLSEKVKAQLDIFLAEHAYHNLFIEENGEVFSDENLSLVPNNIDAKIKVLEGMIKHYIVIEDYEKCAQIRDEIDNLKHNKNGKN